ncbi:MAG TPA: hypothetical protein VGR45_16590 [Stellaceae bacterium]|nr:hypothetical protein [Stellaceae bacterium]
MLIDRRETDPVGFHLERARGAIAAVQDLPRLDCVRDQTLSVAREHMRAAVVSSILQLQVAEIEVLTMLAAQRRLEAAVADALEAR